MFDHVKLAVSDVKRSKGFYERALEPLGYRVMMEPVPGLFGMGRDRPHFWFAAGETPSTAVHLAFGAESDEQVDRFHAAGLAAGGTDNGPPGLRPQYHPGYYGAFVLDPDGNNVEAVYHHSH